MRKKDRKWLERIADSTGNVVGMYRGEREDFIPETVAHRLGDFIRLEYPHNDAHKARYVITEKGLQALQDTPAQ